MIFGVRFLCQVFAFAKFWERNRAVGVIQVNLPRLGHCWWCQVSVSGVPFCKIGAFPKLFLCSCYTNTYLCLCVWSSLYAVPELNVECSHKLSAWLDFCLGSLHHNNSVSASAMQLSRFILLLFLAHRLGKKRLAKFIHTRYRKDFFKTLFVLGLHKHLFVFVRVIQFVCGPRIKCCVLTKT